MRTASVRDLRNQFGKLSEWLDAGETIEILKHGKPYARVIPSPQSQSLLGCMKGSAKLAADVDAPLNVKWEAAS